jgi:dihydrofolate reductase (trimethoprim resistance protein)
VKLSLMAAKSRNGIIGNGPDIPWKAKGEQLLFKAITYNQWLLVGRKTFESMGVLPNRKYAVVTRSELQSHDANVMVFSSIDQALKELPKYTNHLIVSGGGEIYKALIGKVDTLHLSTIDTIADGDIEFPLIPDNFKLVFEQWFDSNIDYNYQIWQKVDTNQPSIPPMTE